MGPPPYRGPVDSNGGTCVACGATLGVGRFCLNCGHPIGAPAPTPRTAPTAAPPAAARPAGTERDADAPEVVEHPPIAPPVQAADPTPVAPTSPPDLSDDADQAPAPNPAPAPAPAPPRTTVAPPAPRPEWDPREDLLPYEEVDDVDEPPIQGRAWIAWVAGAVLLVGLVFLLLRVFATDGDDVSADSAGDTSSAAPEDTSAEEEPAEDEPTEAPRGVGRLTQLATDATFDVPGTAPPTTDFDGNLVAYEASQMADGNPSTTWRTAGDATGQTITVTLRRPGVVTRVGLVNGYAKQVAGVDWYPNNRRILAVTWGFDDGSTVEQTFAERPGMQRLKVPPVETSTVTITLTSVTPPGAGNLGRDYTAISEVSVIGRRAG